MKGKRKTKAKTTPADVRKETAAFVAALKRQGQVQAEEGPLKPGVTHVLKKASPGAKQRLVRKRFSAL